jgi:hypothetical protein
MVLAVGLVLPSDNAFAARWMFVPHQSLEVI